MKNKQTLLDLSIVALAVGPFFMLEEKINNSWQPRFAINKKFISENSDIYETIKSVNALENQKVVEPELEESLEFEATHRISHYRKKGPAEIELVPGGELYFKEQVAELCEMT